MPPPRAVRVGALIALIPCMACSDRTSRTLLVRPQVGRYSISGQVRVMGRLAGVHGDLVGTRALDGASDVRVRLRRPDGSTDSALTQGGVFGFRVDDAGVYRVSSYVCPEILSALDTEITDADVILPDTLTMAPAGPLRTYPNPFPAAEGLAIEFTPQLAGRVEIAILSLAGVALWTYGIDLPPGFQHFHWSGIDNDGKPLPSGAYWCVVRMDNAHQYNLVFKE